MKIGSCHWLTPGRRSKYGGRSKTKSAPISNWSGARSLTTQENMRLHEESRRNQSQIFEFWVELILIWGQGQSHRHSTSKNRY